MNFHAEGTNSVAIFEKNPPMEKLSQDYSKYKEEDFLVWKTLFKRQMGLFPEVAAKEYLHGIEVVGFSEDKIPDFGEVNERLGKTTGWELSPVPSIIPNEQFFPLIANKKFPATTWLRRLDQLDYLPEPDMFHDVLGHVPLLSDPHFSDFFTAIGKLGVKYLDDKWAIELLGRIYWFTVEFGLINAGHGPRIYGAGILSSHGETKFSLSEKPTHILFSVKGIFNMPYQNDQIQDKYFVISSFEQLFNSLPEIERYIENEVKVQKKHKENEFSKIHLPE
jgi:phenylalanine-4-hydroxylase